MTTNVWRINWRDSKTGAVVETAGVDYPSWDHADAALSTLLGFRRHLTATIDRVVVDVPVSVYYVTRILDRGTEAECVQTWEGPFNTRVAAQNCLNRLNVVQPQFTFFIEEEKA
jgi:hypothetical protein